MKINDLLDHLREEDGYREIKRILWGYLEERGFQTDDEEGPPNEIWTHKNGVTVKTIIRKAKLLLCKNTISFDLHHPGSLPEMASVLQLCHSGHNDCKRCAFPAIERSSRSEMWKFLREMQEE
jgi:hypothetical protein